LRAITCGIPAAWKRSAPPPVYPNWRRLGALCSLSLPRNPGPRSAGPGGKLTYPGNGCLSGVFSGGDITAYVEAFAGAQGQRGERGFEHGGWERAALGERGRCAKVNPCA